MAKETANGYRNVEGKRVSCCCGSGGNEQAHPFYERGELICYYCWLWLFLCCDWFCLFMDIISVNWIPPFLIMRDAATPIPIPIPTAVKVEKVPIPFRRNIVIPPNSCIVLSATFDNVWQVRGKHKYKSLSTQGRTFVSFLYSLHFFEVIAFSLKLNILPCHILYSSINSSFCVRITYLFMRNSEWLR